MKLQELSISQLETDRLLLVPFTLDICESMLYNDYEILSSMGLIKGEGWPDIDMMETIPKIIQNISIHDYVTGFESWMIIKKETNEIIGDVGFKGFDFAHQNVDIGYGIILEERKKGYAEEACIGLMNWAFEQEIVKGITAKCLIHNIASINLLKKLGFQKTNVDEHLIEWSLERI